MSYTWILDLNANKTVNVDCTTKNINFPKIQFGYGGGVINRQNYLIHLCLHFQSQAYFYSMKKHANCFNILLIEEDLLRSTLSLEIW